MPTWTSRPTKTLRRVDRARWIDPAHVSAVEPTTAGKVRVHLVGGTTLDLPAPSTEPIEKAIERVLRALLLDPDHPTSDPTRRDPEDA